LNLVSGGVIPKPRVFASGARACPEGLTATPEGVEWESRAEPAQWRCPRDLSPRLKSGFAQSTQWRLRAAKQPRSRRTPCFSLAPAGLARNSLDADRRIPSQGGATYSGNGLLRLAALLQCRRARPARAGAGDGSLGLHVIRNLQLRCHPERSEGCAKRLHHVDCHHCHPERSNWVRVANAIAESKDPMRACSCYRPGIRTMLMRESLCRSVLRIAGKGSFDSSLCAARNATSLRMTFTN